jgi:flavin reductase (DIM6/NTAB) family NADH-FMN oxidoreductase RutF
LGLNNNSFMPSTTGTSTENYHRLLSPRVVVLVTALRRDKKPNTMAVAWHSPISIRPPVLAVAISPLRCTHGLILATSEFTISIPSKSMLRQVEEAGSVTGKEVDKSALFSYSPAKMVKTPVVQGCLGSIECTLNRAVEMGDHSVIFGNVVHSTSEGMRDVWEVSPLLHMGSNYYAEFIRLNEVIK